VKVTLRGDRMWKFLDRLISLAMPRIRDFPRAAREGVRRPWQLHIRCSRSSYMFPEIDYDKIDTPSASTSPSSPRPVQTNDTARLCSMPSGFPFKRGEAELIRSASQMAKKALASDEATPRHHGEVQGAAATRVASRCGRPRARVPQVPASAASALRELGPRRRDALVSRRPAGRQTDS